MYSLLLLEFVINILDFNFLHLNLQKPNCQISFFATTDGKKNGFFFMKCYLSLESHLKFLERQKANPRKSTHRIYFVTEVKKFYVSIRSVLKHYKFTSGKKIILSKFRHSYCFCFRSGQNTYPASLFPQLSSESVVR